MFNGSVHVVGFVEKIENDSTTNLSDEYFNNIEIALDARTPGAVPGIYRDNAVSTTHKAPGPVILPGYAADGFYVDGQGAVASDLCMKVSPPIDPAVADMTLKACGGATYDKQTAARYNSDSNDWVGMVELELLEAVPSTATECTIHVVVDGACTGCGAGSGEPAGGAEFVYGGVDVFGHALRAAGDKLRYSLMEDVTQPANIEVEVRPVTAGTGCTDGASCSCTGLNAFKVTVHRLPGRSDL